MFYGTLLMNESKIRVKAELTVLLFKEVMIVELQNYLVLIFNRKGKLRMHF